MTMYDQRVAERFGADVRKNIRGALHPNLDTKLRDLHIQAAYDDARIAFHFAALVRSQQLEAPRHSYELPRPASAPQIVPDLATNDPARF